MYRRWPLRPLAELADFVSGGTPSKSVDRFWNGSIPWVTVKDMKTMRLGGTANTLTERGAKQVRTVPTGSVLVLVRGMGLFRDLPVVHCDRPMSFNQDIKGLVPKDDVHSEYLAFAITSRKRAILRHVESAGHGTGRLDVDLLKSTSIPIPPLQVQQQIVRMLRTWEGAIEKATRLVAIQKRQKRALMQELLVGTGSQTSRRYGPWRSVRLGQLAKVIVSSVDKRTISTEQAVKLCNYKDVYDNHSITPTMGLQMATATVAETERFHLEVGDVLVTKDSEDPNDIAVPAIVEETSPDLICGYHLAIIRPGQNVDGWYLKHWFDLPQTRYYFACHANGATRFGLTVSSIDGAIVRIPRLRRQRKLASIISLWDAAIRAASRRASDLGRQQEELARMLIGGTSVRSGAGGSVAPPRRHRSGECGSHG